MKFKSLLLHFILILISASGARAQAWEVGLGAGAAGYMGDLNPDNPLKVTGMSAGVFAKLNFNSHWALGLHYNYGRISGDDSQSSNADFKDRNLKFYTPLNEVSAQVDFNFFDYFAGGGRKNFTPYIYAGLGGVIFNPKIKINGETRDLRLYKTEGQSTPYRNYAISIPYGAGVKFNFNSNWSFFSQVGYRTAYTDYLDDVSGVYKYPVQGDDYMHIFLADPSGHRPPGSQRGDSRKRDTYMFMQIGISYTFLSEKCFTF